MSTGYHNYQTPIIVNDRSGEGLSEANIQIGDLKCILAELEIKIQALYSVMVEQGIDPKVFDAKLEELSKNRAGNTSAQKQVLVCPECGKNVKPSPENPLVGKCLFCGAKFQVYPKFS